MSFELSRDHISLLHDEVAEKGAIDGVQTAGIRILPFYSAERITSVAVEGRAGNCYTHADVLTLLGMNVPGCTTAISLSKDSDSSSLHTEPIICTGEYEIAAIDNARIIPKVKRIDADKPDRLDSLIVEMFSSRNFSGVVSAAMGRKRKWHAVQLESILSESPTWDFNVVKKRLVVPSKLGLKMLRSIAMARELWYEKGKREFDIFVDQHSGELPFFDIEPLNR